MTKTTGSVSTPGAEAPTTWLPLIVIVLAQIQMAFNVNALPVSIGPITEEFGVPATTVATALVVYSLFVAAFVMLGAKLAKLFGARVVFQATVVIHGLAMGGMAFSPNAGAMLVAQAVAGLAAAALVPCLVILIAANFQGAQQSQALGVLAGAPAMAGAAAFFIAGFLGTAFSWRYSFGILVLVAGVVLLLSYRLKPVPGTSVKIDGVGALLAAVAIILISFGVNNLSSWGLVLAHPSAPFSILGLSPAPLMIILGIVFGQGFFWWSHRRQKQHKAPLLSLEVLDSPEERSTTYAMFIIGALGPAVNFLIPMYLQIVQGSTTFQTAIATVPYTLAIFVSAVLVVRLYGRFNPRVIGSVGFGIVALGLVILAFAIQNEWGTPFVILGLLILGMGEGALLTLVFNVLVSFSPKELAGDVGALRGTANNLSTAVGTALAGLLAVSFLTLLITSSLVNNPTIPPALKAEVPLDNINFVSNDQLLDTLDNTSATPAQVAEAVAINTTSRLLALKYAFLVLAGIALLAIVPSLGLPNYMPGNLPNPAAPPGAAKSKSVRA